MADSKISNLPTATALDGTEVLPIIQGTTTKQATLNQVRELNILYKGRLAQAGTSAPVITDYINPNGLTIVGGYGAVGQYSITGFTGETFTTSGNYEILLSQSNILYNEHIYITPASDTSLSITTTNTGVNTDGILRGVDGGGNEVYQVLTIYKY